MNLEQDTKYLEKGEQNRMCIIYTSFLLRVRGVGAEIL